MSDGIFDVDLLAFETGNAKQRSAVTDETPLAYSSIAASDALEKVLWEINLIT